MKSIPYLDEGWTCALQAPDQNAVPPYCPGSLIVLVRLSRADADGGDEKNNRPEYRHKCDKPEASRNRLKDVVHEQHLCPFDYP